MHGTHLAGRRLKTNHVESLYPNDILTLGADVTRGESYFSAPRVRVTWKWCDERYASFMFLISSFTDSQIFSFDDNIPSSSHGNMYRNTFSADYSEEEHYDDRSSEVLGDQEEDDEYLIYEVDGHVSEPDDEVQLVHDSVRQPSVEILPPQARTFTVPESDDGSTRDSASSVLMSDKVSAASSAVITSNANEAEATKKSKVVTLATSRMLATTMPSVSDANMDSSQPAAINPADDIAGGHSEFDDDSNADSYADDELDNEYPDPFETDYDPLTRKQPNNARLSASLNAVQPSDHARAPSPSDAAMVKPSGESSNPVASAAPPFPPYAQYGQEEVEVIGPCGPHPRSNSAWAGHNSVLYEPVPRSAETMQWAPIYTCAPAYQPMYPAPFTYQAPAMPMSARPRPPLTIASLVQQHAAEESNAPKKRKADQISSNDFNAGPASSELAPSEVGRYAAPIAPDAANDMSTAITNTMQNQHTTTLEVTENVPVASVEEPVRKKVRKVNKQRGRGLVKMAAATITGMAIGAVGTIIGLAALPQEFFA